MAEKNEKDDGRPDLSDPGFYKGADGERERKARKALLEQLADSGVGKEELKKAVNEGRLAILPVEVVLAGETPHTLTGVARKAKLDNEFLREVIMALGRPNPQPREKAFTDDDVEQAQLLKRLVDAGLPRDGIVEVSRVIGQAMSMTAGAVRRLVAESLIKPGDTEFDLGLRYANAAEEFAPLMGPMLEHELRTHIREGVRREVISRAELETGALDGTEDTAVAFADLVNFTKLGEELDPQDLGGISGRLAHLAANAAKQPAQLVKTIGDAAMLVAPEVPAVLESATRLLEAAEREEDFPDIRVGIAYGPVLNSHGDWFGAPVNLASRITDFAKPGTIWVEECAKEKAGEKFEWSRKRRKSLKGVERRTTLFRLDTR